MSARKFIDFCLEDKSITYRIDFETWNVLQVTDDGNKPVSHITFKVIEHWDPDDEKVDKNTIVKYIGFSDYEIKIYIKN
jgi:hypothetical protein